MKTITRKKLCHLIAELPDYLDKEKLYTSFPPKKTKWYKPQKYNLLYLLKELMSSRKYGNGTDALRQYLLLYGLNKKQSNEWDKEETKISLTEYSCPSNRLRAHRRLDLKYIKRYLND